MSKSKRTGTAWETLCVLFFRAAGFKDASRNPLVGVNDIGDIRGIPGWALECKAERAIDLAGYMKEAEREAANGKTRFFAAIVKRRNKGVDEGYVVMPMKVFVQVLKELNE